MNNINSDKNNQNNQNNQNNNEQLMIMDLISRLENLGKEKDKTDFVENYTELKSQVEKTDMFLNQNDDIDEKYNSCSIQELFSILETNSEFISNPEKLDISKFKMLLKISKILEEKLEIETMNIIESK